MPSSSNQWAAGTARVCQWVDRADALERFVRYEGTTQSQQHIKPLHWYVACRLVLEGGFHPDEVKPRPPFTVTKRRGSAPDLKSKTRRLEWSPDSPALESDTCNRLEIEIRHSSDPSPT